MTTSQILVVEDERIVATCIKNELESFGYGVCGIASTASEAIEMAVQHHPNLVLMDIHLKGETDGIEAAREIHARCEIPVVYLSAFADSDTIARAAGTECYGYLLKPYEERELQTNIETALGKYRAEQRLAETERWLAAILEGIDDVVLAADRWNRVRFMNLAAEVLTGFRKEDAVGSPLGVICPLVIDGDGEEQRERILLDDLVNRAICKRRVVDLPETARLVGKDGQAIPVEGILSPIYDHRGEFLGTTLILRSVGARIEFERVRRTHSSETRSAQAMPISERARPVTARD